MNYHSHRINSNHKLPGAAAVCVWRRIKLATQQRKLNQSCEFACMCVHCCTHCMHVRVRVCAAHCVLHRMHHHYINIMALRSNNSFISPSPPLFIFRSLSILFILVPSNRVWTSAVKQTAACTVGERKRLQNNKKKPSAGTRRAAPNRAGHCFGESGFSFVHI